MIGYERMTDSKYVILIRHGEIENPRNISYNRDSIMRPEDVIHLSSQGREQMKAMGSLIQERGFNVSRTSVSPQIRAQESAEYLIQGNSFPAAETEEGLDEIFSPGPYLMGMKTDQIDQSAGNTYEGVKWEGYNHEQPQSVVKRMRKVFDNLIFSLKVGESGILISHGDPIAWLLNDVLTGYLPKPGDLRNNFYPEKGRGYVVVLNSNNKVKAHFELNPEAKN